MTKPAKWALTGAVAFLGVVFAAYLSSIDLSGTNHILPQCTLKSVAGFYCPGCGNTRAVQALLHLDVAGAFRQNALFTLALPVLGFVVARAWWTWMFPEHSRPLGFRWPLSFSVVLIVLVFAFAILRNIPEPPFSWLAPVPLEPGPGSTGNPFADPGSLDQGSLPSSTQ